MSVTGSVYQHVNFGGRSQTYFLDNNWRYYRVFPGNLQSVGLHDSISSAKLFPDNGNNSLLICFQHRFQGRYLMLCNPKGSGVVKAVNSFVPLNNMNDVTSSILLMRTKLGNEMRLSAKDLIKSKFVQMLDAKLSGTQASRVGEPIITWDMWPVGQAYLDQDKKYIKLHQKLHIAIDWWPDYEATMTYHIYLYLDNKKLKGYAARWWLWVEGGVKSDDIWDALAPKVEAGMDSINTTIQDSLGVAGALNFKYLYYLPGKQDGAEADVKTGHTDDDVTIVLQTQ